MIDLQLIASDRIDRPLSEWPEHRRWHNCTLMGEPLFDNNCLRCVMEEKLTEKLKKQNEWASKHN